MKCPRCSLINPDTALICDCGWDFSIGNKLKCPKCQSEMKAGVYVGSEMAIRWINIDEDENTSFWDILRTLRRLPVKTYRCISCSYLESYAWEE
jgi:Domain of unknown function (DUF6487)